MKLFLTSSPIGIYRSEEPLDYLLQTEDFAEIRGEAYRISEGEIRQIGKEGDIYQL